MAWKTKVLVGQSGGPTAAINASLAGVYARAKGYGAEVVGMRYGIEGYLSGNTVDLDRYLSHPLRIDLLRRTPSSWLGSCRYRLPEPDDDPQGIYERLFALFADEGIGAVLYIGGNDSMDTIAKLSTVGTELGSPVRFIGVPKTIDNDLMGTDHTPGYGSAAKFVATCMREIACDSAVYNIPSVTFVEIMGRGAGWLAGSACLAGTPEAPCPDLVLLPEVPLSEEAIVGRIERILTRKNTVVVAVSEGLLGKDGKLMCEHTVQAADGTRVDAFGHVASLSGTSRYLASVTRAELGCKTRAVELSTLQRCASHIASAVDLNEAYALGGAGVIAAHDGMTGMMSGIERIFDEPYLYETVLTDVHEVANQEKSVPREWIADDGMGVTADFERYARPLIDDEESCVYVGGVPMHLPAL